MNIEEEFFKCFGIEPKIIIPNCLRCWHGTCVLSEKQCKKKNKQKCKNFKGNEIKYQYPPITDRILLELIVIITKYTNWFKEMENIEYLKQEILKELIGQNVFENFEISNTKSVVYLRSRTMNKYIVKNCPCFVEGIIRQGNEAIEKGCNAYRLDKLTACADRTDCLIKQTIAHCQECNRYYNVTSGIAQEVLELFEIEEVEEELSTECIKQCPYYRSNDMCKIYEVGVRECHKFPDCMYRKWQRAEKRLQTLQKQ